MLRLFTPAPPTDGQLEVTGDELHHLRTWRLGVGDPLLLFDPSGQEHAGVLAKITARSATVRIESSRQVDRESPLEIVLAPALLKGRKLDLVVEKSTELGVTRIAPFSSAHTIGERGHHERWERIALAAAKQSGRTKVPEIIRTQPLDALLRAPWPGLKLLAWENEHAQRLGDLGATATALVVVVGPEGGFAPGEVDMARAAAFHCVTLGARVLRAETASIAAVAALQHRWGDG
jgi:16S rRNA (uracil1498-N3)-methyltransferase